MKKKFLLIASILVAIGFAACRKDEILTSTIPGNTEEIEPPVEEVPTSQNTVEKTGFTDDDGTSYTLYSVEITQAGTLEAVLLKDFQKYEIDALKITGPLDGTDLRLLRDMAGCDTLQNETDGELRYLDMTDATIVSGGLPYNYAVPNNFLNKVLRTRENEIGDCLFYACRKLTKIKLPATVIKIGWYAFHDCSNLTEVTIPNSVTEIGFRAFEHCGSLTEVTIPNSVTKIESGVFAWCSSLIEMTIPNSITSIESEFFFDCSSLTRVSVPNTVTSIGRNVFWGCSSLTEVTIPNSVTEIGSGAFGGCSSLTEVTIPNSVTFMEGSVFENCSSLTKVTIPNSITSIGYNTFRGCSSLTDVTIPNSVTEIVTNAFSGCSSLNAVTSLNPLPPACKGFDTTTKETAVLHVPSGSAERYKTAWGFSNIKEDAQGQ